MSDYKQELENIESKINKAKEEKIRLEEQKKSLKKERAELTEKLKEEGIKDVGELEGIIVDLEIEIQKGIEECQKDLEI